MDWLRNIFTPYPPTAPYLRERPRIDPRVGLDSSRRIPVDTRPAPPPPPPPKPLAQRIDECEDPVLVAARGGYRLSPLRDLLAGEVGNDSLEPPPHDLLLRFKSVDRPLLLAQRIASSARAEPIAYAIALPPGFDVERRAAYNVQTVVQPAGVSFREVLATLARDGGTAKADTVTIVVALSDPEIARRAAKDIVNALAGLNLDTQHYSVTNLVGPKESWRAQIANARGVVEPLDGPWITVGGSWRQFPPTTNYKAKHPAPRAIGATEAIPEAMQKQPANRGAFFTPVISSRAIGESIRCGIYLPPGYDPKAKEKYPVLLMLPGKGNPLNYWTSAGQIIPKLNHMMSGDALKMIVVIPDNTDSYYFDTNRYESAPGFEKGDYERFALDEVLGYALTNLKGDREKLSVLGISRGGFGALSIAARHPGLFHSVSAHSGIYMLEDAHSENELAPSLALLDREKDQDRSPKAPWSDLNPLQLVQRGAFGSSPPRLYVDVGDDDLITRRRTLDFVQELTKHHVPHQFRVIADTERAMKHDWDTWGPLFDLWVRFHQDTYGKGGAPVIASTLRDAGEAALKRREDSWW